MYLNIDFSPTRYGVPVATIRDNIVVPFLGLTSSTKNFVHNEGKDVNLKIVCKILIYSLRFTFTDQH